MNTDKKNRISIGITPDVLEKLESIFQTEYLGVGRVQSVILAMIDLGLLAVDYCGNILTARATLEHKVKEQESQPEPAIIPSHGIVLEFPFGKRLPAG